VPIPASVCGSGKWVRARRRQHVVRAELRRIRPLPHVLHVEIGIEILAREINLERLFVDHFCDAASSGFLRLGSPEKLLIVLQERRFLEIGGSMSGESWARLRNCFN